MEDALGVLQTALTSMTCTVLILVLVEDALGEEAEIVMSLSYNSLNPCFSGRCSRS